MRGGTENVRVFRLRPLRAVTCRPGAVRQISCSMYEPSLVARYFHSKSNAIDDCTLKTSGTLSASSLIAMRKAILSSSDTVSGLTVTGTAQ